MIIFQNPGLIELDAIRTMGVSVKLEGSFGMFGTGFKYGLATALRGGAIVTLYRGTEKHVFDTVTRTVRGEAFEFVRMDGVEMGFTSRLGLNWEPWMVLREFGCNARDDHGDFFQRKNTRLGKAGLGKLLDVGSTTIIVQWPALDEAFDKRDELFLTGAPAVANDAVTLTRAKSDHLFYRGIRVFKLPKPSKATYNILATTILTEDRSLYGEHYATGHIAKMILRLEDRDILRDILCAGDEFWEHKLDLKSYEHIVPSNDFLAVADAARRAGDKNLNPSARDILLRYMRKNKKAAGGGYYSGEAPDDRFTYAIKVLEDLGMMVQPGDFMLVEELREGVTSMVEGGAIFFTQALLEKPTRDTIMEIGTRLTELRCKYGLMEEAVKFLLPKLLAQHEQLRIDEANAKEMANFEEREDAAEGEEIEQPMAVAESDVPF